MNYSNRRLLTALTLGLIMGSNAKAVEPLRTNGASFRIPFAVDQSTGDNSGTAILFASKDGAAMEPVQRVNAGERSFHFLAPSDGKFQFAVRMMNSQGELIGEDGPLVPELEVIVDSKPPAISMELAETASGEAILKWSYSEEDVLAETLKIEYLESGTGVWKSVMVGGHGGFASGNQATIRSNPGQSIAVRASVSDSAGNVGSGTGQIVLSRQSARESNAFRNDDSAKHAHDSTSHATGAQNRGRRNFLSFGAQTSQASGDHALSIPTNKSQTILGTSPFSLSDEGPADNTQSKAVPMLSTGAANTGSAFPVQMPSQLTSSVSASNVLSVPQVSDRQAGQNTQFNHNTFNQGYTTESDSGYQYSGLDPQHMNNRLFDLAYEIDSVGPSGVGLVVLYVTEDNGRNWFRYGDDKDLKSPAKIDTRGEGTFGFSVRVHNGVGFSDPPPQPGEAPSVLVTVDQTPPALRMARPELVIQGQGAIRLRWEIQEANPADAAVRLEYSTSPEGPWAPVFDWQQNPNGFEMPVDNSLPSSLHFRLLARDQAGNVSTTQTAQPVLIDRKRPKARVLSVKPTSATPGF